MVEKIQTLLVLLGIIGMLAVVAERVKFPFPILLVLAGLLIALVPSLPEARLDPELVFLIFLPPLLFSAAWNFPWEDFRSNFMPILALAVGLVFATIVCVAYAAHWLIPGMTLATGYVLGAIVSPPDAVAATAVFKNLRVPKRLSAVLEGESLVNDASGLVAYQFAVAAVVTGSFSLVDAGGDFVWTSVGGALFGLLIGMGAAVLHRKLRDPAVEVTLTILTPYIAYLPAERFGFSGVLAVVAAGLFMGHRSWEALAPESRLQRETIWQLLDYLLNGVIFILIGLQFPTIVREMRIPVAQMILYWRAQFPWSSSPFDSSGSSPSCRSRAAFSGEGAPAISPSAGSSWPRGRGCAGWCRWQPRSPCRLPHRAERPSQTGILFCFSRSASSSSRSCSRVSRCLGLFAN